jgi:hypothetical protein
VKELGDVIDDLMRVANPLLVWKGGRLSDAHRESSGCPVDDRQSIVNSDFRPQLV